MNPDNQDSLPVKCIDRLQYLIQVNSDCQRLYGNAADAVHGEETKTLLQSLSSARRDLAHTIRNFLGRRGIAPTQHRVASPDFPRLWMNLRASFEDGDLAVLEVIEGCESQIAHEYKVSYQEALTPALQALLQDQTRVIQSARQLVRDFRTAVGHPKLCDIVGPRH
jgi:uncharacterized protein (TIGR02284 family)